MSLSSVEQAVDSVNDGDELYIGGFGYAQPFSVVHELIRQEKSELSVIRSSGDILLDQLVGAGCVTEAIIAHCWNAVGPTPTYAFRRAVEEGKPSYLAVEEFGLGNLVLRLFAGARRLPFVPAGPVEGTGQFEQQTFPDKFVPVEFDGERHYVMRPLNPDVSLIHVQRADSRGNAQLDGARAEIKYGAMAADKIIVSAEKIVSTERIREDPEKTILPEFMTDTVISSPGGSHPAGMKGHYDRDVPYLEHYGKETSTIEGFERFLEKWVYGVDGREEYLEMVDKEGFTEVRG